MNDPPEFERLSPTDRVFRLPAKTSANAQRRRAGPTTVALVAKRQTSVHLRLLQGAPLFLGPSAAMRPPDALPHQPPTRDATWHCRVLRGACFVSGSNRYRAQLRDLALLCHTEDVESLRNARCNEVRLARCIPRRKNFLRLYFKFPQK